MTIADKLSEASALAGEIALELRRLARKHGAIMGEEQWSTWLEGMADQVLQRGADLRTRWLDETYRGEREMRAQVADELRRRGE